LIVTGGIAVNNTSYLSDTYTKNIYPSSTNYSIGSNNNIWQNIYCKHINLYDHVNKYNGGEIYVTSSTSTSTSPSALVLGNATSSGAGNRYGLMRLYSTSSGYVTVRARTGITTTQTFYLPSHSASSYAVWSPNSATAIGSSKLPVYIDATGKAIACTDTDIFSNLTSSTNTLSITIAGKNRTANIINSISNTWTAGTTSGPTLKTTVNGVAGTAVAIPSASNSASGIVTTGA
jgi:hypothetical protein